jgi:hypothetical protein
LKQSHPIEVELTIDADKISRWRFRPAGHDWCEALDVANPWIGQTPSVEIERLQTQRAAIRAILEGGAKPNSPLNYSGSGRHALNYGRGAVRLIGGRCDGDG